MRTLIAWTLTLALGASASAQQVTAPAAKKPAGKPAQAPAPKLDPNAEKVRLEEEARNREELEQVLVEWEKRSKGITTLDVLFDRIDRAPAWGNQYYQGRAMLQSPDLACLQFQKYKVDKEGRPLFTAAKDGKSMPDLEPEPYERIVCTGSEVLQYSWDDRKIFVFPLDKQARQKALQQGPLPFLFNMKAAETRKRYSMTLLKPEKPDPRNHLIGILPNEQIDRDSFSKAFLWLSKETYMPTRLRLYTVGEKEYQEFLFTGNSNTILANKPMDRNFFAKTIIKDWKVIENPAGDAPAANAVGQPARKPAAQAPAKGNTRPR